MPETKKSEEKLTAQGEPKPDKEASGAPSEAEKKKNDEAYHEAFPKSRSQLIADENTAVGAVEPPTDAELAKADKGLPVFDPRDETPPNEPFPDTPSGAAVMAVGNLNGEEVEPDKLADANTHGEAYLYEKRKRRWGYDH